jgi:hypothetical protein
LSKIFGGFGYFVKNTHTHTPPNTRPPSRIKAAKVVIISALRLHGLTQYKNPVGLYEPYYADIKLTNSEILILQTNNIIN